MGGKNKRRRNIKGGEITPGRPLSVAHSAAKHETKKKAAEKLISMLWGGDGGNLECKWLSTVCIHLEKEHLLRGLRGKETGRRFFFGVPVPFCAGPVGASLPYCRLMRRRGGEGGEGRWTDGRRA